MRKMFLSWSTLLSKLLMIIPFSENTITIPLITLLMKKDNESEVVS